MSTKVSDATFIGSSGNKYKFDVYPMDTTFRQGLGAVYVMARRYKLEDGKFTIFPIYFGETSDIVSIMGFFHPKQKCFDHYNANCKCLYLFNDSERRKLILEDLISNYDAPCND